MKSLTLNSGFWIVDVSKSSKSTKLALSHQLSHHNIIQSPLPTFHLMPFLSNNLLLSTLFQAGESVLLLLVSKKHCDLRYFRLTTEDHKPSDPVRTFQASLAWKARLTASVFLNPNPLRFLGWQILSHATIGKPFSVPYFFQKKVLFTRSRSVVVFLGSWKHCIVCIGKDSRLNWISTTLPALDKLLAFQASIRAVALSRISVNVDDLALPWKTGHPKYFPSESPYGEYWTLPRQSVYGH